MNAVETAKQESIKMQAHTKEVIYQMAINGEKINFYTVAAKAGVSRAFLYNHEELSSMIQMLRLSRMTKHELQTELLRLRLQNIKNKK